MYLRYEQSYSLFPTPVPEVEIAAELERKRGGHILPYLMPQPISRNPSIHRQK